MKSKSVAYMLWLAGLFGILGFHRFYLGKIGTGLLWLCTLGLMGFGAMMDLFLLGGQVDQVNTKAELDEIRTTTLAQAQMNAQKASPENS